MEESERLKINEYFDIEIVKYSNKFDDDYISFVKQVTVVCFAIIGLMSNFKIESHYESSSLYSLLQMDYLIYVLFGFCILIGVSLIYAHLHQLKRIRRHLERLKQLRLKGLNENKTSDNVELTKIHTFLRCLHMIVFSISVIYLILYSIL